MDGGESTLHNVTWQPFVLLVKGKKEATHVLDELTEEVSSLAQQSYMHSQPQRMREGGAAANRITRPDRRLL